MEQMSCMIWLWSSTKRYRLRILTNSLIGMARVAFSFCMVWVCKLLIDAATHGPENDLDIYASWLALCLAVQLALSVSGGHLENRLEISMRNRIRSGLFGKLIKNRQDEHGSLHTGDMINRMEEDVPVVTNTLCREIPYTVTAVCQLVSAFIFLYLMDASLAFVLVCLAPAALLGSKFFLKTMRRLSREIRKADSDIQIHLQESLQHRILVRTMEYVPFVEKKLHVLQSELQYQVVRRTNFSLFSRAIMQGGFSVGYLATFLWGVYGLLDGTVSFGMMTAFLQLVAQIQRPMYELSRQLPALARTMTSAERLMEIASLPEEEIVPPVRLAGAVGIRMENVRFSYPQGGKHILEEFNHDFIPGTFTAIVGETGAGKSTLFKLLLGLYSPDNGKVFFYNSLDKQGITASSATRCNLSYVPQNNILVSGTIRENLLLGNPDATEEELYEALYTAAADFVHTLPQEIDTPCGERNSGLSEGQVQRIAIARGLLRSGNILLLDEPTSALDNGTERMLLERLSRSSGVKTVIMITHSEFATCFCADVIRI